MNKGSGIDCAKQQHRRPSAGRFGMIWTVTHSLPNSNTWSSANKVQPRKHCDPLLAIVQLAAQVASLSKLLTLNLAPTLVAAKQAPALAARMETGAGTAGAA
jgi:hypothetical protein